MTQINCGCAGKTPLDRIVRPARDRVSRRLAGTGVRFAGDLDCALLPRTDTVDHVHVADDRSTADRPQGASTGPALDGSARSWAVSTVLATTKDASSVERFTDVLERGYRSLTGGGLTVVGKAHSVQVLGATSTVQCSDVFTPVGDRRPGFRAANVDFVHAFPGLDPAKQAGIATVHALNDCYAVGAAADAVVRPIVAVPETAGRPDPDTLARWYRRRAPPGATVRGPQCITHDGRDWLFGATVTTTVDRIPPIHTHRLAPGDGVLLTRPLGALAWYAHAENVGDDEMRRAAAAELLDGHASVADTIRAFSPEPGDAFDAAQHVKVTTDISGPGLLGVARLPANAGCRLRVDSLPFLDQDAIEAARDRWLVPDATIGTNGPIAVFARDSVLEAVAARLAVTGGDPHRIGELEPAGGPILTADTIPLDAYIENTAIHPGSGSRRVAMGESDR